jgi:hypothetical protein
MRCGGFQVFGEKAMNSFIFSHPESLRKGDKSERLGSAGLGIGVNF